MSEPIWVVFSGSYSARRAHAVFPTKADAEGFAERANIHAGTVGDDYDGFDVVELPFYLSGEDPVLVEAWTFRSAMDDDVHAYYVWEFEIDPESERDAERANRERMRARLANSRAYYLKRTAGKTVHLRQPEPEAHTNVARCGFVYSYNESRFETYGHDITGYENQVTCKACSEVLAMQKAHEAGLT